MTFISEHGLVRYAPRMGLKKLHIGKPCEGCARPSDGLDHCHAHDWIRGTLCSGCNVRMQAVDARRHIDHGPVLLKYWENCPDCAAGGPWAPIGPPEERLAGGRKTSIYLTDELAAAWRASGVSLGELIRRGLGLPPSGAVDESTLRRIAREVIRDELAGLPVADGRAPASYGARDYERTPYLEDP